MVKSFLRSVVTTTLFVSVMRKTIIHAHRQAWCWQDEYHGLTIADIRKMELETQLALQEKMGVNGKDELVGHLALSSISVSLSFYQMKTLPLRRI